MLEPETNAETKDGFKKSLKEDKVDSEAALREMREQEAADRAAEEAAKQKKP